MIVAVLKLIPDLLIFVSPQLLRAIIDFVSNSESAQNPNENPLWHGIFYAVLLFIVAIIQTLLNAQCFQRLIMIGLRIRTATVGAMYRKALRLSNTARKESTVGEIVNLMAVDAQHLMDLTSFLHMLWSCPLQIGLALYFLYDLLGCSAFAGELLHLFTF